MPTAEDIDALLPQTQCTRCGYAGCRPYADAIAADVAQINQCPPGGGDTILALAKLLNREPLSLNSANGAEGPALVAVIDEDRCIGCVKCLPPCPVDAIVGSRKQMHTVIAGVCTGCELCIAPCPVDCITMVAGPTAPPVAGPAAPSPQLNRIRYDAHVSRLARRSEEQAALLAARKQAAHTSVGRPPEAEAP
jgi:electron transport complex protein RnfB